MPTASEIAPFSTISGSFFVPFLEAAKKAPKNRHKRSIWRLWRPNASQSDPRGSPKGGQNPSKIITKSSLSRRGRPPTTFDLKKWSRRALTSKSGPGGDPPLKNTPKIHRKTHDVRCFFGRVWILGLTPKRTKKWRAFRPVFYTFWGVENPAEYWKNKLWRQNFKPPN